MMNQLDTIGAIRAYREALGTKTVGFVPTMGHLHEGHVSLVARAKEENDQVVLSLFINPTQFNNSDDFKHYPKTLESDLAIAKSHGVDAVFIPTQEMMYPDNYRYKVTEGDLATLMEGQHRPGHFEGVLTVVLKLFNLVKPHRAYFGEKDYQQYQLIKNMVKALFLDIEVVGCPTVRDDKGLALSSRNSRLSTEQKQRAHRFHEMMKKYTDVQEAQKQMQANGFKVDYMVDYEGRRYGAAFLGDIRLIDNIPLSTEKV